ncbi:MAG TPA: hypothetical protein ENF62_00855 [Candidatus Bathyarchaeota archaeon]|nr:hypothetical protein [Candidatus Bathyarchaeota archaeon]
MRSVTHGMDVRVVSLRVPGWVDERLARLIFELGLAELMRDFHRKAEVLAYIEAKGILPHRR